MADWSNCVRDNLLLSHLLEVLFVLTYELVVPPEGLLLVIQLNLHRHTVLLEEGHAFLGFRELVGVNVDDLVG